MYTWGMFWFSKTVKTMRQREYFKGSSRLVHRFFFASGGPCARSGLRRPSGHGRRCALVYTTVFLSLHIMSTAVVVVGCLPITKLCWVGKHIPGKYYYETDELPNPRPTQTKKKKFRVAFGPLFPTANTFSGVRIDFK